MNPYPLAYVPPEKKKKTTPQQTKSLVCCPVIVCGGVCVAVRLPLRMIFVDPLGTAVDGVVLQDLETRDVAADR